LLDDAVVSKRVKSFGKFDLDDNVRLSGLEDLLGLVVAHRGSVVFVLDAVGRLTDSDRDAILVRLGWQVCVLSVAGLKEHALDEHGGARVHKRGQVETSTSMSGLGLLGGCRSFTLSSGLLCFARSLIFVILRHQLVKVNPTELVVAYCALEGAESSTVKLKGLLVGGRRFLSKVALEEPDGWSFEGVFVVAEELGVLVKSIPLGSQAIVGVFTLSRFALKSLHLFGTWLLFGDVLGFSLRRFLSYWLLA